MGQGFLVAQAAEVRELNEVAALVWRSLDGTRSLRDIASSIADEYEVSEAEALSDVVELVEVLVTEGLATV